MQIAQSSKSAPDPLIETLKMMSDPVRFKVHIETLEDAKKKFDKAKKEHDDVLSIAKTINDATIYATKLRHEVDMLEAKCSDEDKKRKAKLDALETSITRREGAFELLVKEHTEANNLKIAEQHTEAQNLARLETTLERGRKQLAQDNYGLKQNQDALSERRARLAQALKN